MSHALLIVAGLTVAQPPVVPELKPVEMPSALRERLLTLAVTPAVKRPLPNVEVLQDGVVDRSAVPLHADDLAALEWWLRLRPHDESARRRAIILAELAGLSSADHRAALERTHARQAAERLGSAAARVRWAESLLRAGRLREAADEAQEAARLDPASPDPLTTLAAVRTGEGRWEEAARAFESAGELAPADWRVPAARGTVRCFLLEQLPAAATAVAEAELAAVELDRQTAVRLGGSAPACLRWSALTAVRANLQARRFLDPVTADRQGRDRVVPALAQLADAEPADSRAVSLALYVEFLTHSTAAQISDGQAAGVAAAPPDARLRYERRLRRVAAAVAVDDGPEAAEKAVAAVNLFLLLGQTDRAVSAAERAVAVRPASRYCEATLQQTLLAAGRPADALARCRANRSGRKPADDSCFELACLHALGRWGEARELAAVETTRFPRSPELSLLRAADLLRAGTPAAQREANERLLVLGRAGDETTRAEVDRLTAISLLLAGRYAEAEQLLDTRRLNKQPVRDEVELSRAARPYTWPRYEATAPVVVPAGVR